MTGIVDCHTHIGLAGTHVGGELMADLVRCWGRPLWHVPLEEHAAAMEAVDRAQRGGVWGGGDRDAPGP